MTAGVAFNYHLKHRKQPWQQYRIPIPKNLKLVLQAKCIVLYNKVGLPPVALEMVPIRDANWIAELLTGEYTLAANAMSPVILLAVTLG